jgi:hypothetical protein
VTPDAPIPVALSTYSNRRPGAESELVILRAGADLPSLAHDWYLRVTLPTTNSLTYRIRVNVETNGILSIGAPLVVNPVVGTNGLVSGLSWRAIPGESYRVDEARSLALPVDWTPVSTNTATSDFLLVGIPAGSADAERYLRAVQVPKTP